MQVERDRVVLFHYTLKGEDGEEVGSSPDDHPVAVLQGHGHIIPGLETALAGHAAGDEFQVTLPPEQAYGPRLSGQTQRLAKKHFAEPKRLKAGQDALLNTRQGPRRVMVLKVGRNVVDVDLNHPLAGRTLVCDLRVVDVREATPEELAHGHAHGPGGHHH